MDKLYAGDALLGTLTLIDCDQPSHYYSCEPTPEYEVYCSQLELGDRMMAPDEYLSAGERLDFRVVREDGSRYRVRVVFFNGNRVTIRGGMIRAEGDNRNVFQRRSPK